MASVAALGFSIISRYSGGGVAAARRDLATLRAQMVTLNNDMKTQSGVLDALPKKWALIGKAAASVAPALIPIGAAALQAGGAVTAMAAGVGIALGAYGLAMKGAITQTLAMAKAGKALDPVQKTFVKSVDGMKSAWQGFIKETSSQTLSVATHAVNGLSAGIKLLPKLVDAVHPSVLRVSQDFESWMKGDQAKKYAGIIADIAKTSLPNLVDAGKAVLNVLGDGFRAFAPLADDMSRSILKGAMSLQKWSDGGGFQRFIEYVKQNAPAVKEFWHSFGDALKTVFNTLKEFSGGSLNIITDFFRTIANMNPESIKAWVLAFTALRSPILFLILNCPPLRDLLMAIAKAFTTMPPAAIYALAAAFAALNISASILGKTLMATLLSPVGLVIVALAALTVGIVYIATKTTWFQTAWTYTWNAIKVAFETVYNFLTTGLGQLALLLMGPIGVLAIVALNWSTIWGAMKLAAETVWTALTIAWTAFVGALSTAWTAVSGALVVAWNAVWAGISLAATTVWNALTLAWSAFTTALATAWTAVSTALVTAWNAVWLGLQTAAQAVWTALTVAWNAFTSGLATAWTTVSTALVAAWNAVWSGLQVAAQAVWTAMQVAWTAFVNALATAWTAVSTALVAAWQTVWSGMQTAAQAIWTAMQAAWTAFINALQTIWSSVSGALTAAWNAFWNALKTVAQGIWTAMQAAWQAFMSAMQAAWSAFSSALTAAWNATWNALKTAAQAVWTAMQAAWQAFMTAMQTIWSAFSSAFSAAWNAMWNAIKTAAQAIWTAMQAAWQAFFTAMTSIYNAFKAAFQAAWSAAWNAVKSTAQTIWDAIKAAWTTILNGIKSAMSSAMDSIKKIWSDAWNAVKSTAQKIWGEIKSVISSAIDGIKKIIHTLTDVWNKIAGAVGLDSLKINFESGGVVNYAYGGVTGVPEFKAGGTVGTGQKTFGPTKKMQRGGGVLRGYSPGRDTVPAVLSRGEGVLVPEAVRGLGADFVHGANYHFSRGRAGNRNAASGFQFAEGGMVPGGGGGSSLGGTRSWHRDAPKGWHAARGGVAGLGETMAFGGGNLFATGGLPGEIPAPDPNKPGKTSGTVGEVPGQNEGDSDGGQSIIDKGLDLAKGYAAATLKDLLGGNAVLGFIGKEVISKAFDGVMGMLGDFGMAGNFGKMAVAGTKKLVKGMIDKLVAEDEKAQKEFTSMSVAGAKSVQAWAPLAAKAIALGGLAPGQLQAFLALMSAESGGNPNAINRTDINAQNGIPSQGLMQVIPPTFAANHVAGTSNNILDPLANMAAAARYIKNRYGGSVPGSPYALGTPGATSGMHLVGEQGPEMVNFQGGETVTPAKETASILTGVGTAPAMAPAAAPAAAMASPAMSAITSAVPDITGMVQQALSSGGTSDDIIAQINAIIAAAQEMATEAKTAWAATSAAGASAQSTLTPVLGSLATQHGTTLPASFTAMSTASGVAWSTMTTAAQAQWLAMQTGVFVPANTEMTTTVPASLAAMNLANTTQWTAMSAATAAQWTAMRDGTYTEAGTYMGTSMPTWGTEMNTAVSAAWAGMAEATGTSWSSMEEGTSAPVNWIISNSYGNGIAAMWNAVADVIWEGGGKSLPSVATLATGGPVHGPGTGTSDSVPAMLSRGEHVWTAKEVARAGGHHAVWQMRNGLAGGADMGGSTDPCGLGHYATGGVVGDLKRGDLWSGIEAGMTSAVDSARSALGGTMFSQGSGSADVFSPADWIEQYVKKDDELNKMVGGPPWVPGVSDVHTSFGGYTVNQRTADMLAAAGVSGLAQGSFSSGVGASAGTHDGGGAADITSPMSDAEVGALRGVGFAAWRRTEAEGFSPHIHAIAMGDPTVSPAAAAQQQAYLAGRNGLADNGPDTYSGGITAAAYKDVDPADIKQNVVSYDQGGMLQPGYTMAYNGTGKPEPVGHDLVPRGASGVTISMPITITGNTDAEKVVAGITNDVLPKLRVLLQKGTGNN